MPTIEKEFHFCTDTEGWNASSGSEALWIDHINTTYVGFYTVRGKINGRNWYVLAGKVDSTDYFALFWTGTAWEYWWKFGLIFHSDDDVATPDLAGHWVPDAESIPIALYLIGIGANVNQAWYPPHKRRGRIALVGPKWSGSRMDDPLLSLMGGCLRTSARRNGTVPTEAGWEYVGTWEDLGVPAGATINTVQGDYIWRYVLSASRRVRYSDPAWGTNELGSGPFELRDPADDSLIDTFSARDFAPSRATGVADLDQWPVSVSNMVAFKPSGWQDIVGSAVAPGALTASSDSVKLVLRSLFPVTVDDTKKWIRLKQDYVKLTIDYKSQSNFFWFQG